MSLPLSRRLPLALGSAFALLLLLSCAAQAANQVLWANLNANNVGLAPTAGGSGQNLVAGGAISEPLGLAVDPAAGKFYWAVYANPGSIWSANLDGTGSATLVTDQEVRFPRGMTLDPNTNTLYWINDTGDSLRRVQTNGSGNSLLYDAAGLPAQMSDPQGPVVDPTHNRIYWVNFLGGTVGYASLDGSGSPGTISFSGGCVTPTTGYSVALSPGADRLWFSGALLGDPVVVQAHLDGSSCTDVAGSSGANKAVYGLASDPDSGRLLAAFPSADGSGIQSWSLENMSLSPEVLDLGSASTVYALYPNIIASPAGSAVVTPDSAQVGDQLSCTADWDKGTPSMMLFRAPASATSYSWSRDGQALTGADASTLTTAAAGSYACTISATNFAGAGSATSVSSSVTASPPTTTTIAVGGRINSRLRRSAKARLTVTVRNTGSIAAQALKICVKPAKGFRVPRQTGWKQRGDQYCRSAATLAAGAGDTARLALRAGRRKGKAYFALSASAANAPQVKTTVRARVK